MLGNNYPSEVQTLSNVGPTRPSNPNWKEERKWKSMKCLQSSITKNELLSRPRLCYWGNVLIFIRLEAQVFSICCFLQIFYVFHIYSLLTFLWLSAFHVSDRLGATRNWEILFASTRFFCFFNPDCNIFSSDILLLLLLSKWFCFSNLSKI